MLKGDTSDLVWKALADSTRREILDQLRLGAKTTGQLSDSFEGMTRYGVMKHLKVLEEAQLITVKRSGRERYNYLNANPIQQIYERWMTPYQAFWSESFSRLKRRVEKK